MPAGHRRRRRDPARCYRTSTLSPACDRWRLAALAWISCSALLCTTRVAAQSPRPAKVGVFFWHDSLNDEAALRGIRAAMDEAERDVDFVVEQAGEDTRAATRILRGFRDARLDLVFAMGTQAALLAAEHLKDVPIVFTAVTNPVEAGVVAGWKGSGANLAGNSNWIAPATLLHVFRLTVPDLTRLGVLRSTGTVVSAAEVRSLRKHVQEHPDARLEIVDVVLDESASLGAAVESLAEQGVQAIWIPIDRRVYTETAEVFDAARKRGIPIVSSSLRGTRNGATAGVVVDYEMLGKRAAAMALQVLDGEVAIETLPVGTMDGYRVVVNTEAARRTNYALPLSLLVVADELLDVVEVADGTSPNRK